MKNIEKALSNVGAIVVTDGDLDYQIWYTRPQIYMRVVQGEEFQRSQLFENMDEFRAWVKDLPEGFGLETPIS